MSGWINQLITGFRRKTEAGKTETIEFRTARDLHPEYAARIAGFSRRLTPDQITLLRAYGLVPGVLIKVIQQSPVSIIQVEHAEIAIEAELASGIFIEAG